jgi:hypothetical protein
MLGTFSAADLNDKNMSAVMQEIDPKGAGELTKDMFTAWYIKSEKRIHAQVKVTRRGGCNCAKRPHV